MIPRLSRSTGRFYNLTKQNITIFALYKTGIELFFSIHDNNTKKTVRMNEQKSAVLNTIY